MRALVIGASGFLGLNVVDALLADGHAVRATVRKRTVTLLLRQRGVELVPGSLEDPASLERAMAGCDAVFLVAGHYPKYSIDREASIAHGVAGVRNACDAALAAGVPRFVYTSSVGSLAAARGRAATEDDVPETIPTDSTYRAVKWAMEREVERAAARGLPAVTLLPGGCVGPWDLRVGTGALLVGAARAQLPWWVDGTVNLVDVRDVARAHIAAAQRVTGHRYILGGTDVRVSWLLRHIVSRYGGAVPDAPLSSAEARARADADERAAAPLRRRVPVPRELVDLITTGQPVSSDLARRDLGVRFTPIEDALDSAHAWFVRFKYIAKIETPRTHDQH